MEVNLVIQGRDKGKYEIGAIVPNENNKEELDIILYNKKPLDETTSNSLKD